MSAHWMKTVIMVFLLVASLVASPGHGYAQTNAVPVHRLEQLSIQINQQLQVLSTNKSAASVRPLRDSMNTLEYSYLDELGSRKDIVSLWLKVLTAVDQDLDLSFDPTKPGDFSWHVRPPLDGPSGIQYPAGTAPETLKDLGARSNYVAAIQSNYKKAQAVDFQRQLHELNDDASTTLGQFLRSNYSSSQADKKELDEIIQPFALTPYRRKQWDGLVNSLPEKPAGDFPFQRH